MKVVKFLVRIAVVLVVIVVVALALMPLWFKPVVTGVANLLLPRVTGTESSLESVAFNPYTGAFRLYGLHIANPEGFATKDAVCINTVSVDVVTGELLTGGVHLTDLTVAGLSVNYLNGASGSNNFDVIVANAKSFVGADKAVEQPAASEEPKKAEPDGEKKPVMIDLLSARDMRVQVYNLPAPIPLPDITLRNIGHKNGTTFAELRRRLGLTADGELAFDSDAILNAVDVNAVMRNLDGKKLKGLGKELRGDMRDMTGVIIKKSVTGGTAVGQGAVKTGAVIGKGIVRSGEVVGTGVKKSTEAIGNGAKKVGGAVTEGTRGAVKKLGGMLGL